MSYIETIIYNYIKGLLTNGLIILSNKRFVIYTGCALIITAMLTTAGVIQSGYSQVLEPYRILFNLEMALCTSMIITGLITLKINQVRVERIIFVVSTACLFFFYYFTSAASQFISTAIIYFGFYSWIVILNIALFSGIRDFLISYPGWVVTLGDNPQRMVFQPIVILASIAFFFYFTYNVFTGDFYFIEVIALLTSVLILYTIFIYRKAYNDSLIASMLTIFFLIIIYHLFVRGGPNTGYLILDAFLIVVITIMSAQGITGLISGKKTSIYYWDSLILIMLGFMLCYHLVALQMSLRTGLDQYFSLYHDVAFGFGALMIFVILIAYSASPRFRSISKREVDPHTIIDKASEYARAELRKVKDIIQGEWKLEIKKPDGKGEL